MTAEVKAFPNRATQFKGGERLGKPRPLIGKRRARKLRAAIAMVEAVHGPMPVFEGDSRDFLRATMRGELKPDPVQLNAATALLKIEYPALGVQHTTVAYETTTLTPEQRQQRIEVLRARLFGAPLRIEAEASADQRGSGEPDPYGKPD